MKIPFSISRINQSDYSDHPQVSGTSESYEISTDEELGKAIYINSFLTVPHSEYLNLTEDWTIELWFKPQSFSTGLDYLIWKPGDDDAYYTNYALHTSAFWGNQFVPMYFSGENRIMIQGGFYPQLNEWYHVAFIRNTENSTLNLIVRNDQREILHAYSINDGGDIPLTSSQDLKIGVDYSGYIDEVRISDVVRNYEPVSAGGQDLAQNLTITPNPASEFIHINNTEKIDVQIFSLTGTCVEEHNNISPNALINVSNLNSGIYLVLLKTANSTMCKKIVVLP